ncbi:MAG: TetR family transcriptional regulator, partial [Chloroflexi bacterium]|nr:TetR family transcriptional regulator [Chloroflexota bacterium]
VWQVVIAPYRRYQIYFASLVQEGITEGSFKPVDPYLTARMIVAQAIGYLLQGVLDPGATDWSEEIHHSMKLLISSLMEAEK